MSFTTDKALPLQAPVTHGVTAVYAQHAGFVWLMLQRLGVRPADLEDALQEVFIVVHRRLPTYDPSAKLTSWLFGICIRVAARFRRRAHARREECVEEVPDRPSNPGISPEEATAALEERRELDRALDTLDPRMRVVFVMFEIDGLSCADIATELDVPVGTVFSRLHAARKAFARAVRRGRAKPSGKGP